MKKYVMTQVICLFCINVIKSENFAQRIANYFSKKHPVEQLYEKVNKEIPDLWKAIQKKKHSKLTAEKLYAYKFMLDTLDLYGKHVADADTSKKLLDTIQKRETSFRLQVKNSLFNVIDLKEPQFDFFSLTMGPGLTLFNLIAPEEFDPETKDEAGPKNIISNKDVISTLYTNFIKGLYNIFYGESLEKDKNDESKNTQAMAVYYAKQTLKIMQKYGLNLKDDDKDGLMESFLNNPNDLFHPTYSKKQTEIKNKLIDFTKQVQKKTKKKVSVLYYKDFINSMMWHADCMSWLAQAVEFDKDARASKFQITYTQQLLEYLVALATYIKSIQDNPLLDVMEESLLIKLYKDFLIKKIKMLIEHDQHLKKSFTLKEEEILLFSQQQINKIHTHVNEFIQNNIDIDVLKINSKTDQFEKKDIEKHVRKLNPSDIRKLLFLQEIITNAYNPAGMQWAKIQDDYRIYKQLESEAFTFWQQTIGRFISLWMIKIIQNNGKETKLHVIENYLYTFGIEWKDYLKKHNREFLEYIDNSIKLHFSKKSNDNSLFKNLFYTYGLYSKKTDTQDIIQPAESFEQQIDTIKSSIKKIESLNNFYLFCTFIKQTKLFDITEKFGIGQFNGFPRTIKVLDNVVQSLVIGNYKIEVNNQAKHDNLVSQVIDTLLLLRNRMYDYLKKVLYNQIPTSLNDAYIKTGKSVIKAVEKIMDDIKKKHRLNQVVYSKIDFTQSSKTYEQKRLFI